MVMLCCAAVCEGAGRSTPAQAAAARQSRIVQRQAARTLRVLVRVKNAVGMRLVLIPPGEFTMGSPHADLYAEEGPRHRVKITRAFYMSAAEVTQERYKQVMARNPSYFVRGGAYPVEMVSWDDAQAFCRKLSAKDNKTYRLPTEAEWEYACRAGSDTRFSFGDSDSGLDKFAWYRQNARIHTHAAGRKRSNTWGLYDMHGNVWEWCADWYAKDYYGRSPASDPPGPAEDQATPYMGQPHRVVRGGAWDTPPFNCRSAHRMHKPPQTRETGVGFRVVCEVKTPE